MIRFALGALATTAVSAVGIGWWLAGRDSAVTSWASIGFVVTAAPGIVIGSWLAAEHGHTGSRFLIAIAAGFVTRLVLAAVAAFGAAKAGGAAGFGLISGLAAGFVPLTAFEMIWFVARQRASGLPTETRA